MKEKGLSADEVYDRNMEAYVTSYIEYTSKWEWHEHDNATRTSRAEPITSWSHNEHYAYRRPKPRQKTRNRCVGPYVNHRSKQATKLQAAARSLAYL